MNSAARINHFVSGLKRTHTEDEDGEGRRELKRILTLGVTYTHSEWVEGLESAVKENKPLVFNLIFDCLNTMPKTALRVHTLHFGPPAMGKSWKPEPIRFMDEAPEFLQDKDGDGAGLAEMKQIITTTDRAIPDPRCYESVDYAHSKL